MTQNFLTRNQDTEFHFMVDIETLATSNHAAITEIGAVGYGCEFHTHCVDGEGERSVETIEWRLANNLHWKTESAPTLQQALNNFFAWIGIKADGRKPILWCKGTDFDATILANAARRTATASLPWKYNDINDVRTLLRLFPQFKVPRDQITHNALEDAILQWTYLERIAEHVANLEYQYDPRVSMKGAQA